MSTTALVLLLSAGLPASTSQAATEHFVVKSYTPAVDAAQLARHAEAMRREVAALWLGDHATATWNPRCEVVVHSTRTSYRRAVGGEENSTVGSTLVRFSQGRIVVRRIDLLGERTESPFETIAHELVHVIFAERFRKTAPPRWAEEGAALMADSHAKRLAHRRDFAVALREGSAFRVSELVRMSDYPPPTRCAAFYGQSLVLVDFLMRLGEPADFARFVDCSLEAGHDRALREVYGIASTHQLESLWHERAVNAVLAAN